MNNIPTPPNAVRIMFTNEKNKTDPETTANTQNNQSKNTIIIPLFHNKKGNTNSHDARHNLLHIIN